MLRGWALGLTVLVMLALPARLAVAQVGTGPESPGGAGAAAPHQPVAQQAAENAQPAQGEEAGRHHEVIEFDPVTAVWVLIIFIILVIVLYFSAWKGVLAGLEAREKRIRGDIAQAEAARAKAEATLREYNQRLASAEAQVREMLNRATTEGEQLASQIRARGQQEAEEARERANRDIEAAKNQAIGEIYEKAADLATSVAGKILRRNLNPEDQRDIVNQSLEQLQTMNKG